MKKKTLKILIRLNLILLLSCIINISFAATDINKPTTTSSSSTVKKKTHHPATKRYHHPHHHIQTTIHHHHRIHKSSTTRKKLTANNSIPESNNAHTIINNTNANYLTANQNISLPAPSLESEAKEKIMNVIQLTMQRLTYSCYKLGGNYFNLFRGVYKIDCSDYVDDVLIKANPEAYSTLTTWTHTSKPTSKDYYNFFTDLELNNTTNDWLAVNRVQDLQPADIIVLHYKGFYHRVAGHVMVVTGIPEKSGKYDDVYWVQVSDSAPSRHSYDTRKKYQSGVGIGMLLFKINLQTGQPLAYAWSLSAPWEYNARFAMARPLEISKN